MKEVGAPNSVNFNEFLTIMQRNSSHKINIEDNVKEAFKILDKTNSGFVTVVDLRHLLLTIGEKMNKDDVRIAFLNLTIDYLQG